MVESDLQPEEQTVTAIAEELQKLLESQVEALMQSAAEAKKLVVRRR